MKRLPALPASALVAAVLTCLVALPVSATPDPAVAPQAVGINKIDHIIVLFPENHSFDNYFGVYPNALNPAGEPKFVAKAGTPTINGLTATLRKHNANAANPWRIDRKDAHTCNPSHAYTNEQTAADNGKLDKFVEATGPKKPTVDCPAKTPMGYYDGNTVTGLWNYAQRFAMSDNTFGTTYGPSTPGALNLVSGQTHGASVAHGTSKYVLNGTMTGDTDPYYEDCSTKPDRVAMSGTNIGDLLTNASVTWGWFQGGFKRTAYTGGKAKCETKHRNSAGELDDDYEAHHEPFQYYASTSNPHHVAPTSVAAIGTNADQAQHQYDLSSFWAAANNGTMPAVSFLKPPSYQDGHPGSSDPLAEQTWLVSTLNRIQQLATWPTTLVIVAWDDSGGFYDHVYRAPINPSSDAADTLNDAGKCGGTPAVGAYMDRCGYGPRLPLLVISPYSRQNFVDHTLNDQTSIIRLIEQRFGLGSVDGPSPPAASQRSYDEMNAINTGSLFGMLNFTIAPKTTPFLLNPSTGLPQ